MSDLHCAVRSETWDAVPALMRFPRADARVALHLTAASGQTRLVQSILRRFAREETEFAASVMNERGDDENGPPDFALSRVDAPRAPRWPPRRAATTPSWPRSSTPGWMPTRWTSEASTS